VVRTSSWSAARPAVRRINGANENLLPLVGVAGFEDQDAERVLAGEGLGLGRLVDNE